jgi:hypothetical protein
MSVRVELSQRTWDAAVRNAKTRAALEAKARKVQSRAEGIASSEGVDLSAKVTSGVRPKGRPYARVSSDNVAQEFGNSKTARRRIMGRAAESS